MAQDQNRKLWESCGKGRHGEAMQALQLGADPNSRGGFLGTTCLMAAAGQNHVEIVSLLLTQPGINVNARDMNNKTAMHYAFEQGSNASLRKLRDSPGVSLNAKTDDGNVGAIWGQYGNMGAIFRSQTEAVRMMGELGEVDLDIKFDSINHWSNHFRWTLMLKATRGKVWRSSPGDKIILENFAIWKDCSNRIPSQIARKGGPEIQAILNKEREED